MIHSDKCQELGLPTPKAHETQRNYLVRAMLTGHRLNTRQCRYIGIGNLHSLAATLRRKHIPITLKHGIVCCPFTNETPPYPVDIVSMSAPQRKAYKANQKREK